MEGIHWEAFPGKAPRGMGEQDEEGKKASQGAVLSQVRWRETQCVLQFCNELPQTIHICHLSELKWVTNSGVAWLGSAGPGSLMGLSSICHLGRHLRKFMGVCMEGRVTCKAGHAIGR